MIYPYDPGRPLSAFPPRNAATVYPSYTVLVSWLQNIFLVVEGEPRYSELAILYINRDQFAEYMLPISVDSTPATTGLRNLHRDAVLNGAVGQQRSEAGPRGISCTGIFQRPPTGFLDEGCAFETF